MRPLTHRVWEEHYTTLRPYILEEWPEVDRQKLETVRGDYDALVALIQSEAGLSSELVQQRLRKLDVDEIGVGTGAREEEKETRGASLAQLRLGAGFTPADRDRIVSRLDKLNRRLKTFAADATDMEISVKDRDTNSQKVTLEAWLPKFPRIVATSAEADLQDALADVREDLWRQIDDAVNKRKEGIS
jgi:ribosome-associated translation inhibitor RaiA